MPAPAMAAAAVVHPPDRPHPEVDRARVCRHCGEPLADSALRGSTIDTADTVADLFCCEGCRFVHELLNNEGLERFYDLRGAIGERVASWATGGPRDHKWIDVLRAAVDDEAGRGLALHRISVDIQGLHCTGCVWLIEQLFRRQDGAKQITVNPTLGGARLIAESSFDLHRFVTDVERFGYACGPSRKVDSSDPSGLLLRLGICVAIAMNAMILAISRYAGLPEGMLYTLFGRLDFALATASVLVGGSLFVQAAIQGLRRGILHLDLPIALGMTLAWLGSTVAWLQGRAAYFDTLDVFVALMLVGRFLQERVLASNRRYLLTDDGIEGLLARRLDENGDVRIVPCTELRPGDRLLIAPGDLVPVDGQLSELAISAGDSHDTHVASISAADFSLDWITGESAPRRYEGSERVPAGAFLAQNRAVVLTAMQAFSMSTVVDLLRGAGRGEARGQTEFWKRLPRIYVLAVIAIAFVAGGLHLYWTNPATALDVVVALLIVTCPCAFGIALPLATELTLSALRRAGVCVRSSSLLDRATRLRRVVFDKTGTLTTGRLRLGNPETLEGLSEQDRAVLYDMVTWSTHPKSTAVADALKARWPRLRVRNSAPPTEHPGLGLESTIDGAGGSSTYRLGSPAWVGASTANADLSFARDGRVLLSLTTEETLRPNAAEEVAGLAALGVEVWILSGDDGPRVAAVASELGLRSDRARGNCTPNAKAEIVAGLDREDTLVFGDGINDCPVLNLAWCSGTPAIDRPFVAARSDFYVTGVGIDGIRRLVLAARRLRTTTYLLLAIALTYNVLTVALAASARMSPLLCAILMPLSSLSTLAAAIASTRRIAKLDAPHDALPPSRTELVPAGRC